MFWRPWRQKAERLVLEATATPIQAIVLRQILKNNGISWWWSNVGFYFFMAELVEAGKVRLFYKPKLVHNVPIKEPWYEKIAG